MPRKHIGLRCVELRLPEQELGRASLRSAVIQTEENASSDAVDSEESEHSCKMIYADLPSVFWFGLENAHVVTVWLSPRGGSGQRHCSAREAGQNCCANCKPRFKKLVPTLILLLIETLRDVRYQNPRNYGGITHFEYIASCRIYTMNLMVPCLAQIKAPDRASHLL